MSSFKPKFWRPGEEKPLQSLAEERIDSGSTEYTTVVPRNNVSTSVEQQRQLLPVFNYRNHILYLVETYQTTIIIGETGSGKSTQIPQYLLEAGWGSKGWCIAVTQPRRVAAVTVATRVANERNAILGEEVGYAIRFEDVTNPDSTRLKFLTDGLLIREMMADPLLTKYSVIMLDEAHERTLATDIVIGLLKKIQKKRNDLHLIVASATLDAKSFYEFFNTNPSSDLSKDTAAILNVEGRMFPVDVYYSIDPVPDYLKATVETVMKIHEHEKEGDVLVFLTGQEEVQYVVKLLIEQAKGLPKDKLKLMILPMHGSLPTSEQMRVFERTPRNVRKIVVATNIAEASITINGIVYVIDSGFQKIKAYNPQTGTEPLLIMPVSQASAIQRSGRAGRVRSGKAFRLFPEEEFHKLSANAVPEMQRVDMASVILQLKALGIQNVVRFNFLSPPPAQNMVRGIELLYALGAVNDACQLTIPLGLQMAEFPLPPMFSKMLIESKKFGCSEEAVTIAAMMQIQNVFVMPTKQKKASNKCKYRFSVEEGDHITLLNVFRAFIKFNKSSKWCHENMLNYKGLLRAVEIKSQLYRLMTRINIKIVSCGQDVKAIQQCITSGFFANAAKLHYSGEYRTIRDDHSLHIHPTSVLHMSETYPKWVIFNEVVHTSKEYMRDITAIEPSWLYELSPHFYYLSSDIDIVAKRTKLNQET